MTRTPPSDLARDGRGRRLWRALHAVYTFAPAERVLLHELCRSLDRIDECRAVVERDGLVVSGSKGQAVAHPLLADERAHRTIAARIAGQLDLPDVVATAAGSGSDRVTSLTSVRARRAARARWERRGAAG